MVRLLVALVFWMCWMGRRLAGTSHSELHDLDFRLILQRITFDDELFHVFHVEHMGFNNRHCKFYSVD